jgi:hypothetical protein
MSSLEFYMARAEQCAREAAETPLANVKELHLNARSVWLDMADRLERTNEERATVAAHKAEMAAQLMESEAA